MKSICKKDDKSFSKEEELGKLHEKYGTVWETPEKGDTVEDNSGEFNLLKLPPGESLPIFNETNISWKTDLKLYRRKFLGDVENPEWEDLALDWSDPESVTTNNLNFVLAATELENKFKQSLIFSVVMPPQLKQFNATLNFTFPYVTFSMSS